jgi:hypothetical protein
MLTPAGMRQRYLLGRYNAVTYGHLLGDTNSLYHETSLLSTDVPRTLQSGYSEMLGMSHDLPEI